METGSTAQDALRAGFQVTCVSGLEKLFKLEELTIESCKAFKEEHLKKVASFDFDTKISTHCSELNEVEEDVIQCNFRYLSIPDKIKYIFLYIRKCVRYTYIPGSLEIGEARIDVESGMWCTPYTYKVEVSAGVRINDGTIKITEKSTKKFESYVVTRAKKASLRFTPYEEYGDRYIPDELIDVIKIAIKIGITDIRVVEPIVTSVNNDPIVIGYINDTMYLIGWFNFDSRNPFKCNM